MKKSVTPSTSDTLSPAIDEAALADLSGDSAVATTGQSRGPSLATLGQVSGDIDSKDLIIPRMEIVQKVGPLSLNTELDFGSLVLNKSTVLAPLEVTVSITVLTCVKSFEEVLPYDPTGKGPRARTFDHLKDLIAAGLWVDWRNDQKPPAREVGNLLVLIKKPDGIESPAFHMDVEGSRCAIASWTVRSTAYGRVAKKVFSAAAVELADAGLLAGIWDLHIEPHQSGGNLVGAPVLKLVGEHTPEVVADITARLTR